MAGTALSSFAASAELGGLLLPPTPDGRVRFSRDAYHRMVDAGVLCSDDRVELLDGEIVMMSPIGPEHVAPISILNDFFAKRLPDTLQCRIQAPVVLSHHSEPEPDVAIVRRRPDSYRTEHPGPTDIVLLIEVAQSSLGRDLDRKMQLYAESEITEYWVVDVEHKAVHVYRDPKGAAYESVARVEAGATIAPVAMPDCRLDVGRLFG
jgi:Uma2 family endonuclease